jgi:mono/diheme cytochrome c family protein
MAVADQTVFVASSNLPATYKDFSSTDVLGVLPPYEKGTGDLTAIDTESGDVKWTKSLASMPLGAVTVANDLVFITEYNGNIFAFNKGNGDQVWTSKLPAGTNSPISISDDTIIVPAGALNGKGQTAQIVAFRIGGLGQIGGAAAPKQKQAAAEQRADATKPGAAATEAAGATKATSAPAGPDGKTIFTQNCGGCHVLANAGTAGTVGPNLDDLKPNAALVVKQVTNGGGGMPAFKGTLSPAEIKAVAAYVSSVAGKG